MRTAKESYMNGLLRINTEFDNMYCYHSIPTEEKVFSTQVDNVTTSRLKSVSFLSHTCANSIS